MNDTHQRTEQTLPLAAQMHDLPRPSQPIDLEAVGREYLRKAKIEAATARLYDNMPKRFLDTDISHPGLAVNFQRCREILSWEYQECGLLAAGPTDRGKSRMMWMLVRKFAETGMEIRYLTGQDFVSKLDGWLNFGRDDAGNWVKALAQCPLVFIDDFGQEAVSQVRESRYLQWFFQFLEIRSGLRLPLLMTTNLSAMDIAGRTNDVSGDPLLKRLLLVAKPVKFDDKG